MNVVYRCVDRNVEPVYVGSSANLDGRTARHRWESIWWPLVADVQVVSSHETRREAYDAEFALIRAEQPRYNTLACRSGDFYPRGADRRFLRRAWEARRPSVTRTFALQLLGVAAQ